MMMMYTCVAQSLRAIVAKLGALGRVVLSLVQACCQLDIFLTQFNAREILAAFPGESEQP